MAQFIGELAGITTKTSKKGETETVVSFRINNERYGKTPDLRDFQGLPCLVEIVQQENNEDAVDTDSELK